MITPEELRVRNYLSYKGQLSTVFSIAHSVETVKPQIIVECNGVFRHTKEEDLQPIPLTQEWLERLGFVLVADKLHLEREEIDEKTYRIVEYKHLTYQCDDCYVMITRNEFRFYLDLFGYESGKINKPHLATMTYITTVETIHRLQNLYYAITGKELTATVTT